MGCFNCGAEGHNVSECDNPKAANGIPPKPKEDGKNTGGKGKDTGKSTAKNRTRPRPIPILVRRK
eukprot:1230830-Amphidinium_carterae.1